MGTEQLDAMIAKIRRIPEIAKRAAPSVAEVVRESILETIAAGTDASGKPWEPRKADGGKPLANAAKRLKVAAVGTRIIAGITGPEARHHRGVARGGIIRGILPVSLTPKLAEGVRRVLVKHFREVVAE